MGLDKILILDFGSQYTQLIAKRVRELNVYSEIHPFSWPIEHIAKFSAKGIILSGSPSSVSEQNAPKLDKEVFDLGLPVLGICYGQQLITQLLGGQVESSGKREYGRAYIVKRVKHPIFDRIDEWPMEVWMSHGDRVIKLPDSFDVIADKIGRAHV